MIMNTARGLTSLSVVGLLFEVVIVYNTMETTDAWQTIITIGLVILIAMLLCITKAKPVDAIVVGSACAFNLSGVLTGALRLYRSVY